MRITKRVTVEESQTTIYAYQERFAQWIALFTILNNWGQMYGYQQHNAEGRL